MEQQIIRLNLIPNGKMPVAYASQYDKGREIEVLVYDGNKPYIFTDETVELDVRKKDSHLVTADLTVVEGTNRVNIVTTEQMCAVSGRNECEIRIIKDELDVGSLNFYMDVERSPSEGGVHSDSEINNLERQMEDIAEPMLEELVPQAVEELVPQVVGENYYNKTETNEAIATAIEDKLDKANPTGTGSFSLNRKPGDIGSRSVAFGDGNTASAPTSFASGRSTIANHRSQHVFGEFNLPDDSTVSTAGRGNYVEIIGNGTGIRARSNARTLDWNGNETLAGDLTFNGDKSLTSEISRLDRRIADLPEAMVFKGTLGVGGTVETLPTASAENEGWTFKCIAAGTYAGLELKVGDTVTCFNPPNTSVYEWEKTGSQDTDTDTWRNIKVNGVEKLGSGISSGAVDFVDTATVEAEFDNDGNKIGFKTKNIYTKNEVDTLLNGKAKAPTVITGTLTAGQTSITLQSSAITDNSTIFIYTTDGTEWNTVVPTTGQVVITFDAQANDLGVKVEVT